jgi:hypothetical protein
MTRTDEWMKNYLRKKWNLPDNVEMDLSGLHVTAAKKEEQHAGRDWHTRALVRIKETTHTGSPEGGTHTFHAGQEVEMVQWGRAGREVNRGAWWTSFDIDGAFIIKAKNVEVIKIIEEEDPWQN